MADLDTLLDHLAERGTARGATAVVDAAMASEPAAPPAGSHRLLLLAVAVIVLAAGAITWRVATRRPDAHVTTIPPTTVAAARRVDPLPGVLVFHNGQILDYAASPPIVVNTATAAVSLESRPVHIQGATVVAVGPAEQATLELLPDDGSSPVPIAKNVAGFAVAADETTIAWSEVANGATTSTLYEASLSAGVVVHSENYEKFARVVGFAGAAVMLDTGDGGDAAAAAWIPSAGAVVRSDTYGTVFATDPLKGDAVIGEGDGTCADRVSVDEGGHVTFVSHIDDPAGACSRPFRWQFSPDGQALVGPGGGKLELLQGSGYLPPLNTVDQVWLDDSTIAAIDADFYAKRCDLDTHKCVRGAYVGGAGEQGGEWLVAATPPPVGPAPKVAAPSKNTPPRCTDGQLASSALDARVAAGTVFQTILLTNNGPSACFLDGVPSGGVFQGVHGKAAPIAEGGPTPAFPALPVVLTPAGHASLGIAYADETGYPDTAACVTGSLSLSLAQFGDAHVDVPGSIGPVCGSSILASAVVAGSSGPPQR